MLDLDCHLWSACDDCRAHVHPQVDPCLLEFSCGGLPFRYPYQKNCGGYQSGDERGIEGRMMVSPLDQSLKT